MTKELERIDAENRGRSPDEARKAEEAHLNRFSAFKTLDLKQRISKIGSPDGNSLSARQAQEVAEDLFDQTDGDPAKVTDDMIANTWLRKRKEWLDQAE